jgi:hypothetical protein
MAQATNIQDYFYLASQKQFARDILFRVKEIRIIGGSFSGNDELVYARSAKLPGRDIEDKTVNFSGQTFHVPGKASFPGSESYAIEFYHDESVQLRTFFELASRSVFDNRSSIVGEYSMPGTESYIILSVLDRQLNIIQEIKLIGASIRKIGEINYEFADGTGDILKFTVDFAYHWYEMLPSIERAPTLPPGAPLVGFPLS